MDKGQTILSPKKGNSYWDSVYRVHGFWIPINTLTWFTQPCQYKEPVALYLLSWSN